MIARATIFTVILLVAFTGSGTSQVLRNYTVYTVNDGLSQSSVYDILQDAGGFIWFGTGDGLNRFDGYDFVVHKHRFRDSLSLSNSTIRGLAEDPAGNLWVGTDKGLNCLNGFTGKIDRQPSHWRAELQLIGISGSELLVYVPGNGVFAFSTDTRQSRLLYKTGRYIYPNSWLQHGNRLHFITDERRWISVNINIGKTNVYKLPSDAGKSANYTIAAFGQEMLLAYSNKLVRANDKGHFMSFAELNNEVQYVYSDAQLIWVALKDSGICLLDLQGNVLERSGSGNGNRGVPDHAFINLIRKDRTGNIWVSVEGTGLLKYSPHQLKFRHYCTTRAAVGQWSSNFIKCFTEDPAGNMYIGSYLGGLCKMNISGNFSKIALPGLNDPTVSALLAEPQGTVLIGTDRGLFRYHPNGKPMSIEQVFPVEVHDVKQLFLTTAGELYIIGNRSFSCYPERTGSQLTPVRSDMHFAKAIYEDSEGNLWCGHDGGITVFMRTGKIIRLNESGFPRLKVRAFFEDQQGRMWVATEMGLVKMSNMLVQQWYGREEGLPDEFIYGLLGDGLGNLWMSTNKGLVKFNIQSEQFTGYRPEDGLQSWEFNTGAFFQSRTGTMYFGGVNGVNAFEPAAVSPLSVKPVVRLTGIAAFGEALPLDTLPEFKKLLRLPSAINTLSFQFTALDFTEPEENTYAYKLVGLEHDWNEVGNRRTAYYTNLPPGSYRLLARASNPDGVWGKPVQLIHLIILPPFYKTWWFRLIVLVALAAMVIVIVFVVFNYKMRKRLAVLERQKEMEVLRNRISRDIHDDIGAGLSKIALLSDIADRELEENSPVNPSLKKIAGSARDMMVSLREIIWAINPRQDDLSGMVVYFRNYTSEFLEDTGIQWEFKAPEILPEKTVSPDIKRNLFLILKESLNNAVKHSSASEILVEFAVSENEIQLLIKDNGKGFTTDNSAPVGNGLLNLKARAAQIGGEIDIHSEEGEGTSIKVKMILR